jgi:hypothetical protein
VAGRVAARGVALAGDIGQLALADERHLGVLRLRRIREAATT